MVTGNFVAFPLESCEVDRRSAGSLDCAYAPLGMTMGMSAHAGQASRPKKSDDDGFADGGQEQLFSCAACSCEGGFMIERNRRKRIVMDADKS